MRTFELLLVYGELFAIAWPAVFGVRPRRGIVAVLLLTLFVLQWQVEGLRWQMIPIYVTALGLVVGDVIIVDRELPWTRRVARGLFGVAGLAVAVVLPLALPVPELPLPTGPVAIGTYSTEIVEIERDEVYGPTPGGPRRFNVQVWYPAEPGEDVVRSAWSADWDAVAPAMSRELGFPSWFLNHTRYVEANSTPDAPVAPGSFPVVIYSHGWTGFRNVAVNQIENLVSNGYIVIAPDHTYGAIATVFDDLGVVEYDPDALPDEEEVGEAAYQTASAELVEVFADDLVSILNALDEGDRGVFSRVANAADLTRIGIYGHSTGGGAAVRVCLEDERCDAFLGLDPWVEPLPDQVIALSSTRPAMYIRSDEWAGNDNDAILRGMASRSEAVTYWIGIAGTEHSDFVVTPLLSPIADRLGLKGPIPAGRIIPILDRYLLGFFDVFLLNTGSAAIDTPSFEEVAVEILRPES